MKKRKDGRYQKKVTLSDGRQKLVYGRTIAEVTQAADELRMQDRDGLVVGDNTTVGEWAKVWITRYKGDLRPATINMYRNAYNNHILEYLGGIPLRDVRSVHVRDVMSHVANQSESLQHKVLLTMRQLFSTARQNGLLVRDPTEGIKTTPHARPKRKEHLSLEEQDILLEHAQDPRTKAFCALCLYCGLRREEALGLQWGDIHDGKLTINRALTFSGGNQPNISQELKTKAAHRTIPIPAKLETILNATPRLGLYVVPRTDGSPMTLTGVHRMWGKVVDGLSISGHPHMLRHSYATSLYHAGIDLKTAQYLLGHSSIQMTANIYTHLDKEDAASSVDLLNDYLSRDEKKQKSSQKVVKS